MNANFFWVDDAFGATQYEYARVQQRDSEAPRLKAAVHDSTKVVFTSRNCIWERAKQQLKASAFPLLNESQVVVDVQALSPTERAQILYNHVRNGGHSSELRRRLKPHLSRLPHRKPKMATRMALADARDECNFRVGSRGTHACRPEFCRRAARSHFLRLWRGQ